MPKFFRRRTLLPVNALHRTRTIWGARRFHFSRLYQNQQPIKNGTGPAEEPRGPYATAAPKVGGRRLPLRRRLAKAWNETPTKWYPLPVGVGALLLAFISFRKKQQQEAADDPDAAVRPSGRWQVHVLGALPLRNMSRVWGYLNSLELPVWFRPTGFKVYAWFFGCNLDEIEPSDLTAYPSLGEFFYRQLKEGARPIANAPMVSPADGRVTHFGRITNARVEQVKGMTYSLDALLGVPHPESSDDPNSPAAQALKVEFAARQGAEYDDEHFANVNGIEYTLGQLLGSQGGAGASPSGVETPPMSGASTPTSPMSPGSGPGSGTMTPGYGTFPAPAPRTGPVEDASVPSSSTPADSISVAAEMGAASLPSLKRTSTSSSTRSMSVSNVRPGNELYFAVIYLAPGDYHRFHSPTAWVVEKRRHFVGELFSVSPWMTRRLQDLFVLNERVALLGRWRHGFFGMVPVGATNVGSIRVNFDETLRTNLRRRKVPPGSFAEATYANASSLLRGQPLTAGQEMGGFRLGSTIVLVFEAPVGWVWDVKVGQKVKVGEKMGAVGPLPAAASSTSIGEGERAEV
ncbi:phosphatidylserine decarboxylase [Clavulina sp. PMI_390]|nr:phosphatidylserine decarboxylase [Clavulina sp. PMI_390]